MEVSYLGHSCFEIKERRGQAGLVTVVIDPFDPNETGLVLKKGVTADVLLVTHDHFDHNFVSGVSGSPYVISGPGEYEVKGVKVLGIKSWHDEESGGRRGKNTIYSFVIGGVSFCHLGDLGTTLTDAQIEEIGKVDVLFIPVGGVYTVDPKKAVEVATQLEPLVVVPMHYKASGKNEVLHDVSEFVREFGKPQKTEASLKITKESLPLELEVVVLEKSS